MKAIFLGILASFFFAFTFILNRSMELSGGSWIWSASLRFIFMVPLLLIVVMLRGNLRALFKEMQRQPWKWILWSFVGFVLFYVPITFAAAYGPGWLIAGTWQITIVAGVLLTPFFYKTTETSTGIIKQRQRIPLKSLITSFVILIGVMLIQVQHANHFSIALLIATVSPVLIAAFAYPLGNRKMMEICRGRLDTFQRVLGMTLASLPFWLMLCIYGAVYEGRPSVQQIIQTWIVALTAGVIATILFFWATDMAKDYPKKLAAVESTQSGGVVFTVIGEYYLLSISIPSGLSLIGLILITGGIVLHSNMTHKRRLAVNS
ncbi:multidrug resistance efflux transporter family protein [Alkalihalobacillus sp. AL-G]|uniref:DMT family transporter n=1 Tax=Alkalihalobacillus sp. AL-G TaxID=2926399 RepID=UPI00272B38EF|nr:multidrug resistance efflux transporter family protein [Alkalihalobacillus sp. AL-G]WLD95249.1 multidrug resistance efflux transporter family protein [Alkalihalobacillus sp. AL-G]